MYDFLYYFYVTLAFIIGSCIGSFSNVVIYRLPIMVFTRDEGNELSLSFPRSHCPQCQQRIYKRDNIPIFSWLFLKGKCRHCHTPISKIYPMSEFIFGLVFCLVFYGYFFERELITLAVFCGVFTLCYAIFFIDIKWFIIPDELGYLLLWFGLLSSVMGWITITPFQSVVSCIIVWLLIKAVIISFKWWTGKDGMGDGDAKLFAAGAAFIGLSAIPWLILLSVLFGILSYWLMHNLNYRPNRGRFSHYYDIDEKHHIPFGPAICLASISLFYYYQIM